MLVKVYKFHILISTSPIHTPLGDLQLLSYDCSFELWKAIEASQEEKRENEIERNIHEDNTSSCTTSGSNLNKFLAISIDEGEMVIFLLRKMIYFMLISFTTNWLALLVTVFMITL